MLSFCSLAVILSSCNEPSKQTSAPDIDDFLSFTPKVIQSIDHTGELYFSHLGYESVVLNNGNIVFADRQIPTIVVINEKGELQKEVPSGRGPGEILDAYYFTKGADGSIYTYDQDNDKIIIFDEYFNLDKEIIPPKYKSSSLLNVYRGKSDQLFFEMASHDYFEDLEKEKVNVLVQYDVESERFLNEFTIRAQPYARLILDGQVRGAAKVPYATGTITAYNTEEGSLFIYDTGTDVIAEIDAQFDTLNSIRVNLPSESISSAERDSLKSSYNFPEQWKTVEELLPKLKAPADKMIYHQGEFWLKSNIETDTEMWLVVGVDGGIDRVVHLPKESILMHVSEEHLGVRLDDVTFALLTNPKPEPLD